MYIVPITLGTLNTIHCVHWTLYIVYNVHHTLCPMYTIHCVQCTHYIGYIGHFTLYTRERNAAGLTARMQIYIFIEVSKDNKDNDDNDNDSDDNDDDTDKGDDGSDNSVSDGDNPDLAPVPAQLRMPGCRACAEKTGGVSWSQGQGAVQWWQPGEQEGDTAGWCSAVMGGWVQCSAVKCWALGVLLVVVLGVVVEGHTVGGRQCNHRHPRDEEVR